MENVRTDEERGYDVLHGNIAQRLGEVTALRVILRLSVMRLRLGARPGSEYAATGDFWTDEEYPLGVEYAVEGATGILTIRQPRVHVGDFLSLWPLRGGRLDLDLTNAVPIDLSVHMGVGRASLDLSGLQVRSLDLDGGVGELDVTLPERGELGVKIDGGVGRIAVALPPAPSELTLRSLHIRSGVGAVRAEVPRRGNFAIDVDTGIGEVTLELPDEMAASVVYSGGLGRLNVPVDRFEHLSRGHWQTRGYNEAAHRATIRVNAGIGAVNVVRA